MKNRSRLSAAHIGAVLASLTLVVGACTSDDSPPDAASIGTSGGSGGAAGAAGSLSAGGRAGGGGQASAGQGGQTAAGQAGAGQAGAGQAGAGQAGAGQAGAGQAGAGQAGAGQAGQAGTAAGQAGSGGTAGGASGNAGAAGTPSAGQGGTGGGAAGTAGDAGNAGQAGAGGDAGQAGAGGDAGQAGAGGDAGQAGAGGDAGQAGAAGSGGAAPAGVATITGDEEFPLLGPPGGGGTDGRPCAPGDVVVGFKMLQTSYGYYVPGVVGFQTVCAPILPRGDVGALSLGPTYDSVAVGSVSPAAAQTALCPPDHAVTRIDASFNVTLGLLANIAVTCSPLARDAAGQIVPGVPVSGGATAQGGAANGPYTQTCSGGFTSTGTPTSWGDVMNAIALHCSTLAFK